MCLRYVILLDVNTKGGHYTILLRVCSWLLYMDRNKNNHHKYCEYFILYFTVLSVNGNNVAHGVFLYIFTRPLYFQGTLTET